MVADDGLRISAMHPRACSAARALDDADELSVTFIHPPVGSLVQSWSSHAPSRWLGDTGDE